MAVQSTETVPIRVAWCLRATERAVHRGMRLGFCTGRPRRPMWTVTQGSEAILLVTGKTYTWPTGQQGPEEAMGGMFREHRVRAPPPWPLQGQPQRGPTGATRRPDPAYGCRMSC